MNRFYLPHAVFVVAVALGSPVGHAAAAEVPTTLALPYGVEDVLRLARAKVADETIVSFIQNSGTVYNLQANDIVYLRGEGVSDRVINAMLAQKRKSIEQSGQTSPSTAPSTAAPSTAAPATEPAATQPAPVYVQPPVQTQASSVYVIPYPSVPSAYYGYSGYRSYPYPYYRPYPYYYGGYGGPYYGGYWRPSISLGFRFGGGYHGHHGFSHSHKGDYGHRGGYGHSYGGHGSHRGHGHGHR